VVTNEQLYLAIGIPILFNGGLTVALMAYINAKFSAVEERFRAQDIKTDALRDLCLSEFRRVEEVVDIRLKHLEER